MNMKNRNSKGNGQKLAMQLSAEQKVQLTLWIHGNKDSCATMSSHELVEKFRAETGISVSSSSIITIRNAVFPDMKKIRGPYGEQKFNHVEFAQKMNLLHRRISRIENELGLITLE